MRSLVSKVWNVAGACALLAASFALAPAASASNFGSFGSIGTSGLNSGVWLTTNSTWTVAKIALTATYSAGVDSAVANQYDPTDLAAYSSTVTQCGSVSYDVCVFDINAGDNGVNGWNACSGPIFGSHPSQRCQIQWVRINQFYSPSPSRIACHELAHTVGLKHTTDDNSCVYTINLPSGSLTTHDKAHINANY